MEAIRQEDVEISEQHLLGDLSKFVVDQLRAVPEPFAVLPETEQRLIIERVHRMCDKAVKDVVNILASKAAPICEAEVSSVKFTDGGLAVSMHVAKSQVSRFELADSCGDLVLVTMPAWAEIRSGERPKATKPVDDKQLLLDGLGTNADGSPPGSETEGAGVVESEDAHEGSEV